MTPNRIFLERPAIPIRDSEVESFLESLNLLSFRAWTDADESQLEFFKIAESWLKPFLGENKLSDFQGRYLTPGTTGSFQSFYQIHSGRRLRVFAGEYPFHRDVFSGLGLSWAVCDGGDLEPNDFLIMSVPFSGDGNIHPSLFSTLYACEQMKIPVLIDCAFAGLSNLILPDLSRFSCIQTICFSLSKFFNMGHFRCGFEFSKYDKGANALLANWDYGPKFSAYIGQQMMLHFPLEFLYRKYWQRQRELCNLYGLRPSDTILFGLGDDSWKEFSRDGFANRVCLSQIF